MDAKEERDSTFLDPTDFTCKSCGSTRGRWITDQSNNGKAIACRNCGVEEKRRRPWRDELAYIRSLKEKRRR